ncbi:antibiotic biosynthesis monooxygenase family protein [Geodermatophilus sp. URMC 61]|uniref:antibiotic biosynthesis monooxygenase family protein n=1 Tax=Geodermatophilus sp. URMC 61 TaxID=3423411 RepID=UPI00406C1FC8
MVLEHALLPVRPGREVDFEAAFAEARTVIAASPGFRRLSLSRCLERPGTYLLLVEWERLEDHTEGFRGSAGYERWRELLHGSYDPFPTVEHSSDVLTVGPAD